MESRTARALAALVVVSLLVVSGAGGSPAQTPTRGGTVVVALQREPACLNPFVDGCGLGGIPNPVLEGAFEPRPDFTLRPQLVSHVTIEERNPFTVTYHIRPEARWSDGVPVTGSDFLFSDRHSGLPQALRRAMRTVRALDEKTVRVSFRRDRHFAEWKFWLFQVVFPSHALAGEDLTKIWADRVENPKTGEPIGSGPFLVERWERGKQLTERRNPRYWGEHTAYLARIVFRFVPPGSHAEALRTGDADLITTQADELQRRPQEGIKVDSAPGSAWEHFEFRVGPGGNPALGDKRIRQALAYGMDRLALIRALNAKFEGESGAVRQPLDSVVLPTRSAAYRATWKRYRHRPAEARRLLEQAGCRRGRDGFYECGGRPLELRFATTAGRPARELVLELVQRQLRAIGVVVELEYSPPTVFFGQLPSGQFEVVLYAWMGGVDLLAPYYVFRCHGENNFTGYCQRLVTAQLVQLPLIMADSRRAALQNRVDAMLARDVPVLPLFEVPSLVARRSTLQNVGPNPAGDIMWNAENWWLER